MSSPRIKMIENNIPRIDKESVSEWLMVAPSLPSSGWHELPVQNGDNYETTKHKWLWLFKGWRRNNAVNKVRYCQLSSGGFSFVSSHPFSQNVSRLFLTTPRSKHSILSLLLCTMDRIRNVPIFVILSTTQISETLMSTNRNKCGVIGFLQGRVAGC